jgi:cob(I)alamin adenosyltransferase
VTAKIYTRRGDDGSTGLFGGPRVRKDDLRVAAYGEVDELNSALGMAREELLAAPQKEIVAILDALQSELFTLGAELATPQAEKAPRDVPHIEAQMVARMEKDIDRFTAELPEMRQFILPGGSRAGAALHFCRTVCRRAERAAVQLADSEPVSPHVLAYLNRLSDLLFVLARAANLRAGGREIPWMAPKP